MSYTLKEAFKLAEIPSYAQIVVMECYNQEFRKYHNVEHIERMCSVAPKDFMGIEGVLEAIIFHDIVKLNYQAPQGLEEALSIAEYVSYSMNNIGFHKSPFAQGPDGNFRALDRERFVIEAINATAYHLIDQSNLSLGTKLLLDLDLFSLALPEEEYDRINQSIKEEYLQFCSEAKWLRGRAIFLTKMLERNRIYYLQIEWEENARRNLQRELNSLSPIGYKHNIIP